MTFTFFNYFFFFFLFFSSFYDEFYDTSVLPSFPFLPFINLSCRLCPCSLYSHYAIKLSLMSAVLVKRRTPPAHFSRAYPAILEVYMPARPVYMHRSFIHGLKHNIPHAYHRSANFRIYTLSGYESQILNEA